MVSLAFRGRANGNVHNILDGERREFNQGDPYKGKEKPYVGKIPSPAWQIAHGSRQSRPKNVDTA